MLFGELVPSETQVTAPMATAVSSFRWPSPVIARPIIWVRVAPRIRVLARMGTEPQEFAGARIRAGVSSSTQSKEGTRRPRPTLFRQHNPHEHAPSAADARPTAGAHLGERDSAQGRAGTSSAETPHPDRLTAMT